MGKIVKVLRDSKGRFIKGGNYGSLRVYQKGYKRAQEVIDKIKLTKKIKKAEMLKESYRLRGLKISKTKTGMKMSQEFRDKLKVKSSWYKGGITPLRKIILESMESKKWKSDILMRDNYTCQYCGHRNIKNSRETKDVHHIKEFKELFKEFLKKYDQFSPIEDKITLARLAINHSPFWDINNGIVLCRDCHKNLHKGEMYGKIS